MTKPQTVTPDSKREAELKQIAKKSFEEAVEWVEENVPEADRCGSCDGVGLIESEDDNGRNYVVSTCATCKGTGKK